MVGVEFNRQDSQWEQQTRQDSRRDMDIVQARTVGWEVEGNGGWYGRSVQREVVGVSVVLINTYNRMFCVFVCNLAACVCEHCSWDVWYGFDYVVCL